MKFLSNFFVSIDQLGNVLAGGNPDNTISSRVGYYTEAFYEEPNVPLKWKAFRSIINFAFYPIDGENHCKEAYYNDAGEEFDSGTSDWAVTILAIIIVPSCIPIALILYSLYLFSLVSPKKINRGRNIKNRLNIAEAKLRGVLTELNVHQVDVDEELGDILDEAQSRMNEIVEKIAGVLNLNERLKKYKSIKHENRGGDHV